VFEPELIALPTSVVVSEEENLAAAMIDQMKAGVVAGELAMPPVLGIGDGRLTSLASGGASVAGIGYAATENIKIAIRYIDGTVIEPGGRFSFDDTARTWDFREDPSYLWGTATSARGIIRMRGGGVCWLATAIWRAAMWSGLATDFRENHYGLVGALGGGFDATNTLVIRNNSDVPVTIRAWMEGSYVYTSLMATEPLDRTANVRGPVRLANGRYAVYQDVEWDDGDYTTREFTSRYLW
jgi:vancomycin resistance protein YoaR